MLGTVFSDGNDAETRAKTKRDAARLDPGQGFQWSERVRDLSARMRYFETELSEEALGTFEKQWLLKLFHHIFDSHDPKTVANPHEAVWRVWVRVELWQSTERLAIRSPKKREKEDWQRLSARMRRRLGVPSLSPVLRSQMAVMINSLRGIA